MDMMKMHTTNQADINFKKLAALFPNAITESIDPATGEVVRAIDKDVLMQEISTRVVEGREERYQFTWPDKKKAVLTANAPIAATLRPVREESVGKDGTPGGWDSQNLYIEGDNLDVLKLLQETYLGKVKMIYIDPPYNTGNDFVYEDDFAENTEEYLCRSGQFDDLGNRLEQNTERNGRFHTNWLNMMYSRLKLAKNLLTDDGVIFISIDDNEVDDLKKICSEIYGESNFLGCAGRITKKANNQGDYWAPNFDYLLTYARNKLLCPPFLGGMNEKSYNQIEQDGPRKGEKYQLVRLYMSNLDPMRGCTNQRYYIECPDGSFIIPPGETYPNEIKDGAFVAPQSGKDKIWRWSYQSYLEKRDQIVLKQGRSSNVVGVNGAETTWNAYTKTYLKDVINKSTATPNSFIEDHINQNATHELSKLKIPFPFAKPSSLMKYLAEICRIEDGDIILDFFSGSASTADSVMQLQFEKGIKCHYILVQIPEKCSEDSDAYKEGFKNICEIGKERIRRAGKKIKEEAGLTAPDLDIGFRVLRLDSSNMEDVYYNPDELSRDLLGRTVDNIKLDRTSEDLLFQVMLDLGVDLSSAIEERIIAGKKVFIVKPADVDAAYLVVCFDEGVTAETVTEIAKMKPYYAVFRDSGMASDSVVTNFDQIFRTYSPQTERKVL
ncbi:MAG: site-specific DNA-methyltransferase [Clostridia bacterium]|nr:site-specific DNA-methyltransferase [Clostridia bacterium]MBR4577768.1 site-specific DNA-methyltransferase [Clostridia bacterium]